MSRAPHVVRLALELVIEAERTYEPGDETVPVRVVKLEELRAALDEYDQAHGMVAAMAREVAERMTRPFARARRRK